VQWERLRPLLLPQKPRTGRPANDHRAVINGMRWILRTGSPWRALPARFGSWKTVSSRFYRSQKAGIWDHPRIRPARVAGDKGYRSPTIRRYLKGRGIGAVIPTRAGESPDPALDRAVYRERNAVERLINRLKQWRHVATRYEKRAANYLAMLAVTAILLWL
jgi:transposase